jgi:hypothetical protein
MEAQEQLNAIHTEGTDGAIARQPIQWMMSSETANDAAIRLIRMSSSPTT